MPRHRSLLLFAVALLLAGGARADARDEDAHRFAIIGHGFTDGGDKHLKQAPRPPRRHRCKRRPNRPH